MLEKVGDVPRLRLRAVRDHVEHRLAAAARSTSSAARRSAGRGSTSSPGSARCWSSALVNLAMAKAAERGLHPGDRAGAGASRRRWRAPASSVRTPPRSTGSRSTTSTSSARREVALAAYHTRRDPRPRPRCPAVRRVLVVLPARGRLLRQGHPRHHPGAPVRQGRDVLVLSPGGRRGRAPAAAGVGEGVPRRARAAVPRHRHRGRRPRSSAARKFDCEAWLPSQQRYLRADLDVELHDVPGPPAQHPHTAVENGTGAGARRSTARCARSPRTIACCSRCTSRPTARCTCPRRCARPRRPRGARAGLMSARLAGWSRPTWTGRSSAATAPSADAPARAGGRRGRRRRARARHRPAAALDGAGRRGDRASRRRRSAPTARSSTTCTPRPSYATRCSTADALRDVVAALRETCPASRSRSRRPTPASRTSRRTGRRWDSSDPTVRSRPLEELLDRTGGEAARAGTTDWPAASCWRPPHRSVGDLARVTALRPATACSRSARRGDEGVALAELAAEHGIAAADVVAFGDMPNDLPMLAWAGRAVAVANAHPEVLAVADEVTASNDDDGVALVLERLAGSSRPVRHVVGSCDARVVGLVGPARADRLHGERLGPRRDGRAAAVPGRRVRTPARWWRASPDDLNRVLSRPGSAGRLGVDVAVDPAPAKVDRACRSFLATRDGLLLPGGSRAYVTGASVAAHPGGVRRPPSVRAGRVVAHEGGHGSARRRQPGRALRQRGQPGGRAAGGLPRRCLGARGGPSRVARPGRLPGRVRRGDAAGQRAEAAAGSELGDYDEVRHARHAGAAGGRVRRGDRPAANPCRLREP